MSNITWFATKNPHWLSRLFSLDRLVVNLIMMEDEESQTHLEPLERESAEEWRPGTGRCGVRGLDQRICSCGAHRIDFESELLNSPQK